MDPHDPYYLLYATAIIALIYIPLILVLCKLVDGGKYDDEGE